MPSWVPVSARVTKSLAATFRRDMRLGDSSDMLPDSSSTITTRATLLVVRKLDALTVAPLAAGSGAAPGLTMVLG